MACAFAGRAEMLEAIFGSPKDKPDAANMRVPKNARGEPLTLTPSIFDRVFGEGLTEQDGRPRQIRYKRGGRTIQ